MTDRWPGASRPERRRGRRDGGVANTARGTPRAPVLQAGAIYGDVVQSGHGPSPPHPAVGLPFRTARLPPRAEAFQHRPVGAELSEALGAAPPARLHTAVLSGLGGVGKTQLAAEHAERAWSRGELDLLVWITAASREEVVTDYARLGAELTGVHRGSEEVCARRFLDWLATTTARWLVVLDDVRRPSDLHELWPPETPSGQTIVTTRRRDAALRRGGCRVWDVGLFHPRESVAYLERKLAADPRRTGAAPELAHALGHLPLALAQAAAYLADRHLTCAEYLARFHDRRRTLASVLPEESTLPDRHRTTVAATWSLSVELADRLEPAGLAAPLLAALALLDPNGVPLDVLTTPPVLAHLSRIGGGAVDAERARDALTCLHRLSLVTFDPASPRASVRVHALVQRAVRDECPADLADTLARVVADALLHAWPAVEHDAALAKTLRANATTVIDVAGPALWSSECHNLVFRHGNSLGDSGQVTAAHTYYRTLHPAIAHRLGRDHPDALAVRYYTAYWQGEAGDTAGALRGLEEVLRDQRRVLGHEHPSTLRTRHNIARREGAAGRPAEAVAEFEKLVALRSRLLGPDHPLTLTSRHELAYWRGAAGDPTGAIAALEDLLADRSRVLGADHPETLTTRGNIAFLRGRAGDHVGAVAALEALLDDHLRVLGAEHPHTFTTRHNIAYSRGDAGDPTAAVTALEQLLEDRSRVLGAEHPHTVMTRRALARWRGVLRSS
ncbi:MULTISPECIES: FxSxx-COOH system tetratricopeptide repeat protein [unclassified Saccharothrix]|uniref:FxSxx-COOH system tetratricopeptide repeat protein n=1 Tax=unclassified Saccharothrix TaxID=2593673 RepID=UPI00307D5177